MAVYTILTLREAQEIAAAYGLAPTAHQPLEAGQANSNYRLDGPSGKYILTIFELREAAEVAALAALIDRVHCAGIPTPRVLATTDGASTTTFGDRTVILKAYVEGEVACHPASSIHHQLGANMARLHTVAPPDNLRRGHDYGVEAFSEVTALEMNHPFLAWLRCEEKAARRLCSRDLPHGLIHGDLFCDNVLERDGELVAILDFEQVCVEPLVFDLGMAIVGMCGCHKESIERLDLEKAAQLVAGYETERRLEAGEREVLAGYVVYAAVATAFWRFRQFNLRYPGHVKRERHREMCEVVAWVRALGYGAFAARVFGGGSQ